MATLDSLRDNKGARASRVRVGRGIGSGKGKTCGRGIKGQKSRSGVAIKGFEGGQMPIFRRLPKRGFTNIHRTTYQLVNIGDVQRVVDDGALSSVKEVITPKVLCDVGLIRNASDPVKLLGRGSLSVSLSFSVDKASASARELVERAGGNITLNDEAA